MGLSKLFDGRMRAVEALFLTASVLGLSFLSIPHLAYSAGPANGRIAFTTSRDGNFEIYVMDSDGTNEERLMNNTVPDTDPSWSPNGTKIAFVRAGGIYIADDDGRNVQRLTQTALNCTGPAWSPDGKKIAFSANSKSHVRDIYSVNASGGATTVLTTDGGIDNAEPSWSPDGKTIVFTSQANGTRGIFLMDSDGSHRRLLIASNSSSSEPSFSPDGGRIVYSDLGENGLDVYVVNADGTNSTRLTGGTSNETEPRWSPDGLKIVFASNKGSKTQQIHIMNADGTGDRRLTKDKYQDSSPDIQPLKAPAKEKLPILRSNGFIAFAGGPDEDSSIYRLYPAQGNVSRLVTIPDAKLSSPRWAPDGSRIAFVATFSNRDEIIIADSDGKNMTTLIQSTSPFAGLDWAPYGDRIVFSKGDSNHKWIFTIKLDGSDLNRLTIGDPIDSDPAWAPDGTKIAFSRTFEGNTNIYVMDVDGSRQKRLTDDDWYEGHPDWSPEGDRIAFVSIKAGNQEIWVMNSDGKTQKNLSNNTAPDTLPSWAPEGDSIIFASQRSGEGQRVYIMDSDGGNQQELAAGDILEETDPDFGPDFENSSLDGPAEGQGSEPQTMPIQLSSPVILNAGLLPISAPKSGQGVVISLTATNRDASNAWNAVSILEVRDEAGITRYIASQEKAVGAGSQAEFDFEWNPDEAGLYKVFVFTIDNGSVPQILSTGVSTDAKVSVSA